MLDSNKIEQILKELNISLPNPAKSVANYLPYVIYDNLIFISGQLPLGLDDNLNHIGKVGQNITLEQGILSARACAINIIAQLKQALEDLDKIEKCIKLTVFVNCDENFTDQPKVANGASDLIVEIFGQNGKHSRAAVGVAQLPLGVSVEIEAVFSLKK